MKLADKRRAQLRRYSTHGITLGAVVSAASGSLALAGGAAPWAGVLDWWIVLAIAGLIFVGALVGRLLLRQKREKGAGYRGHTTS